MANLQQYTIMLAAPQGQLLAEEQEIDWRRTANAVIVETVLKGLAGTSPGSPIVEVDVHNAMPQGGFEFDAGPFIVGQIPMPFQVIGPAGKAMKGDCFILHDNGRHGVNQQARYSFHVVMAFQNFK